jgi:hypothetical protein
MSATQSAETAASPLPPSKTSSANGAKRGTRGPRAAVAKPPGTEPKATRKRAAATPAERPAPVVPRLDKALVPAEHPMAAALFKTFPGEGADRDTIQFWMNSAATAVQQATRFLGALSVTVTAAA